MTQGSPSRRILIVGCGYVGTALGLRLASRGDRVFGLRRDPSRLPEGIEPVAADLLDPTGLAGRLPRGLDAVVYSAGAGGYSDLHYRAAYVEGVENLLTVLTTLGEEPRRVLFTSSSGVWGEGEGEWVDESTPPSPDGFSGSRVLEGEELFRASPFPSVILRLGGIYGPGRDSLVRRVREGSARCPDGPAWSNRIHRDDCAGALLHLLDLPNPDPLYVGVDREPAELCAVMEWLARRLGVDPPPRGGEPRSRGRNRRCSSARLVASGYRFLHPTFREGFEAILAGTA